MFGCVVAMVFLPAYGVASDPRLSTTIVAPAGQGTHHPGGVSQERSTPDDDAPRVLGEEQVMSNHIVRTTGEALRTPRSAAVAGIVFAVLLTTSYVLIRISIPTDTTADFEWLSTRRRSVTIGLALVPFAGIAFLWFIGVVRDRIGELEDRFFSTVFFGSGLLFLAMTFAAAALGGGMVATYAAQPAGMVTSGLYTFSRDTMYRITNIYAIRMSSVFMISLGTIWTRTRTMPRRLTSAPTCSRSA